MIRRRRSIAAAPLRPLICLSALLLAQGCAGTAPRPRTTPSTTPSAAGRESSPSADRESSAPPLSPAPALDPDPDKDLCGAYAVDGVSLGMRKSEVETRVALKPRTPPPGAAASPDLDAHVYTFFAERVGRRDVVEVEFDSHAKDPSVETLSAKIYVAPEDAWPNILFKTLGSPRKATLGEWTWSHSRCGATLKLSEAEVLGGGQARPYRLSVKKLGAPR